MRILIENAVAVVTCSSKHTQYFDERRDTDSSFFNSIYIENGIIQRIGHNLDMPADKHINASGKIIYPGLVNTHHHFVQSFARNIPAAQNLELFDWLTIVFGVLSKVDPDFIYYSTLVSAGELVKYGCTTVFDHQYAYPYEPMTLIERQFEAADALGIRYVCGRGGITRGQDRHGNAPDPLVEKLDHYLSTTEKMIQRFHDPSDFSFHQIAVAPCSPFTVDRDTMAESARLARANKVRLHTHLCETLDEENFCREIYGMRPLQFARETGVYGNDTWYAHGIHFNDEELKELADSQTGIAHCPISNMKLSSGICRVSEMLKLGVPLSLAVDGSASNDGSNMLEELRTAFLLHRLRSSEDAPSASDLLQIATLGGAKILGMDKYIGSLETGKAADLFMIDVNMLDYVGACEDPAAFLGTVGYMRPVSMTMIQGNIVYENGRLTGIDEERETARAAKYFKSLRVY